MVNCVGAKSHKTEPLPFCCLKGTVFAENPFSPLLLPTAVIRGGLDMWSLLLLFLAGEGRRHWYMCTNFASHCLSFLRKGMGLN